MWKQLQCCCLVVPAIRPHNCLKHLVILFPTSSSVEPRHFRCRECRPPGSLNHLWGGWYPQCAIFIPEYGQVSLHVGRNRVHQHLHRRPEVSLIFSTISYNVLRNSLRHGSCLILHTLRLRDLTAPPRRCENFPFRKNPPFWQQTEGPIRMPDGIPQYWIFHPRRVLRTRLSRASPMSGLRR